MCTPLNEEQHSVRYIYSLMRDFEKLHHLCAFALVETIGEKLQSRGRERLKEKEERVRDCVLWRKGFGVGHKFDCSSNFSKLRDR